MSAEDEEPDEEDLMISDILSSIKSIINESDEKDEPEKKGLEEDEPEKKGLEEVGADESQPAPRATTRPVVAAPIQGVNFDDMEESIISSSTADLGTQQFVKLNHMVRMGSSNVTLTDIVRSLLRPMLREWLDENLPQMVEQKVEYEIKRLANRVDDHS